ncbi:ATP-binding cassette domain-containing protein [Streptomyces sp. NPDC019396]|uniref:ABC transporter ATP-binding protein n=1 Tax=Streptomyces sp. NPDC019396 TaxID=3154687 RepID=UPI0033F2A177
MSGVELRNVNKSFGDKKGHSTHVLDDVSFAAEPGEFLVLLGPSGCGKSTSLRIIAGLDRADSGDVVVGGERVNEVPAAQRRIAMVFQNYALFPHLSVAENIVFGLKVRKVSKSERARRLHDAAEMLDLLPYLGRRPYELSGGQRQRVALGRALVSQAQVILMDEPLSNLDAKLRAQMRTDLRALQRELGLTVVYVTHDQVEAMTMADRVVVMRSGRVEQVADPVTLYQQPETAAVARFVGSPPMNLLPAHISGDLVTLNLDSPVTTRAGLEATGDVHLGIRAEDVELGMADIQLGGTVRTVEILGADSLLTVDVGGQTIAVRLRGVTALRESDAILLGLPSGKTSIFDAHTGHRIVPSQSVAASTLPQLQVDETRRTS